jgi:hypothetical protein
MRRSACCVRVMHHGACYFQPRARRLAAEHTHTRTDPPPRSDQGCFQRRFPTGWRRRGRKEVLHSQGRSPFPTHTHFPPFPRLLDWMLSRRGRRGPAGRIESRMELHHTAPVPAICIIPLRGLCLFVMRSPPSDLPASGCGTYMTRSGCS